MSANVVVLNKPALNSLKDPLKLFKLDRIAADYIKGCGECSDWKYGWSKATC